MKNYSLVFTLHFDYNFLDGIHYHLTSPLLPKGKTDMKFNFILDKSKIDGTLKLTRIEGEIIKGKKVTRSQRYPR